MSNPMYFPNLKKDGDRPIATGTKVTVGGEDKACLDVFIQNTALAPVQTGPVQFLKDGAAVEVEEDTAVPGNSIPLPVKLMGTTGPINITAGDINVHLSDGGTDPDVVRIGDGTDQLAINADGSINTAQVAGEIDANNTTAVILGISGVFTGGWTDLTNYNAVGVGVYSNVPSATDGLKIEYSYDGITVHHTHTYSYSAVQGIGYNFTSEFRYFRVKYTNGAVAQTSFKLISVLKKTALFPSSYRLSTSFTDESQVILTKSVITGKTTGMGGGFVDVKVNPSGALAVEVGDSALPTGAATLAEQQTQTTKLTSIDGKIPSNLTVTATRLLIDGSGVTQPVSGTVTVQQGTATNLKTQAEIYQSGVAVGPAAPLQVSLANTGANATAVKVDGSGVTQPVSGSVSVSAMPATYLEDDAHASADKGMFILGVRNDNGATTFTSNDGDYSPIAVTNTGSVRCAVNFTAANGAAALPSNEAVIAGWDGTNVRAVKTDNTGQVYVTGSISATTGYLSVVDLMDTPLLDASASNIPASSSNSLQVIASTAAAVKKIQVLDTTGFFIGVYSGPVATPTILFVVGPGSDQTIEHSIPAGTLISIRSMTTSAITSGNFSMNLMG